MHVIQRGAGKIFFILVEIYFCYSPMSRGARWEKNRARFARARFGCVFDLLAFRLSGRLSGKVRHDFLQCFRIRNVFFTMFQSVYRAFRSVSERVIFFCSVSERVMHFLQFKKCQTLCKKLRKRFNVLRKIFDGAQRVGKRYGVEKYFYNVQRVGKKTRFRVFHNVKNTFSIVSQVEKHFFECFTS